MIVHQVGVCLADDLNELVESHAMPQTHCFHGQRHIINFQNFVVVRRHQSVEWVAHEAETEMAGTQASGLLRCHQLSFPVGVFSPESIRRGLDPTVWTPLRNVVLGVTLLLRP